MKKSANVLVSAVLFCLSFSAISQSIDPGAIGIYQDVDMISRRYFGGTARGMGLAGAQTALGGDLSSVSVNPAGIGVYRNSDFAASAGIQLNSATTNFKSNFYNGQTSDNIDNFHIGNIGIVLAQADDSEYGGDWKSEGIAINYSRLSNYHTRYNFRTEGSTYNLRDHIYDISAGIPPSFITSNNFPRNTLNQDLVSMAFDTYILNDLYNPNSNSFEDDYAVINQYGSSILEGEVSITGGQSQWDFGYGANYQDKLFLGFGMGIASFKRNTTTIYKEELQFTTNTIDAELRSLSYTTEEEARGTGINFKGGLIAKPSDVVRFGLSLETPTFYKVNVKYNSSMNAQFNGGSALVYGDDGTPTSKNLGSFSSTGITFIDDFSMRSPYRFNTGIALFAGKKGFITADAEYTMYNRSRISKLNGSSGSAYEDNNTIKNIYKNALNLRVGAEARLDDLRLRAGYAFYPNNLKTSDIPSNQRQFITGGIGYFISGNYFDVAVVHSIHESGYTPYPGMIGTISNNHKDVSIMFTYGFRF